MTQDRKDAAMTTRGRRVRIVATACCGLAFATTALITAGSASADVKSYLKQMDEAGIHTARGELDLLEGGFEVCDLIRMGLPPEKVMRQGLYNSSSQPFYGLNTDQAHIMYRLAVQELCNAYNSDSN
jgi:hypothetical protein